MKTKIMLTAMVASIGLAPMANAEDLLSEDALGGKFNANVSVVSEYLFRGTSQSGDGVPAIQGGIGFAHDTGFYLNTWASSINFGGNVETDVSGGWSGDVGPVKLDAGAILYAYPGAASNLKLTYWEGYAGVSKDFGFASGGVKFSYSPDWTGTSNSEAQYLEANVDVPAGKYFTINLHAGHQWFDDNDTVGLDDYTDWSIGASTGIAGFTLKAAYVGTDLPQGQLDAVYRQDSSDKFVASISRAF